MDLKERFLKLKKQQEEVSRNMVALEARLKTLEDQEKQYMEKLKEAYGLNTVEEADAWLKQEEARLDAILAEAEKILISK